MKIKHEHIRMAMNAWAHPDGEKVPAAKITKAYFELGMTFPELYDDSHPEALARNTQKIFRWVEKDTPDAVKKIQALLPAIEKAMPPLLVARMRSHSSALMNPLMILVKIIKLRWIHILSYDQMVSRKINNQTTRC
ncbi:toxin YdaT family protein, partial [Escherichia coli]